MTESKSYYVHVQKLPIVDNKVLLFLLDEEYGGERLES